MGALVRFYFVIGPRAVSQPRWWPDLSFEYLLALRSTRAGVRAIPLGAIPFHMMREPQWEHWNEVVDSFSLPLQERFVNVVCSPAGLLMGKAVTPAALAPALLDGVPPSVTAVGQRAKTDWTVEPLPALIAAYTDGHRNIAITGCIPECPSPQEIAALNCYDAVVAPTEKEAERLNELGVRAHGYTPSALEADARSLGALLKGTGDA